MTTESKQEFDRVSRDDFPDIDTIKSVMGDHNEAKVERLAELYRSVSEALEELKGIRSDLKESMSTLVSDVKGDIVELFEEEGEKGIAHSARHVSKTLGDLLKGSAAELVKLKGSGDDLAFLLGRLVQYRNALLEYVKLLDPIESQGEFVGDAVLILEDQQGGAHSCRVRASTPIQELVKQRTGIGIEVADFSDRERVHEIARLLYHGVPGILERRNLLMVEVPAETGLEPKVILNKAATLYRRRCRRA